MVEVTVGGGGQLEGPEADVVESLVVDDESLISVLNQLGKRWLLTLKSAKDYKYEDVHRCLSIGCKKYKVGQRCLRPGCSKYKEVQRCLRQDRQHLVDGEGGVVGLHHGVGHLGAGNHRVGVHDPVRVLLTDLKQGNIFS